MQQEMLERAQCAVTVSRKSGLERAQGAWNRGCLLRIFCNLLQNASKYAPASPIHVQLARTGDRLRIAFADRGPGLRSGSEMAVSTWMTAWRRPGPTVSESGSSGAAWPS